MSGTNGPGTSTPLADAHVHEGKEWVPRLLVLTAVTGVVDAISFLALGHVFTANMTGNVVFMAFDAAGAPGYSFVRSFVALVAFLAGGVIGGRMATKPAQRWPAQPFLLEAALFAAAAGVTFVKGRSVPSALIIVLVAVAMGIRNVTVRKLAVPDMNTTVLTLTVAGLAGDSSLAGGSNPRWARRSASVLAIFAGAAAGTVLVRQSLLVALAICAVVVGGVAASIRSLEPHVGTGT